MLIYNIILFIFSFPGSEYRNPDYVKRINMRSMWNDKLFLLLADSPSRDVANSGLKSTKFLLALETLHIHTTDHHEKSNTL